ncbi:uncharacterized protein LOC131256106 [Magnolia sinica]|uniref:uncharacterized protein LOC131256106 n=1 Tax=Magnolia sinica TaxID=86752 RepID=UPI0026582F25|nr:uncharacterized protein LOC131256106 [Magnolia sinica]
MKSFCIVFCLLTTTAAIRLTSQTNTDTPSIIIDGGQPKRNLISPLDGQRPTKEQSSTASISSQDKGKKKEVIKAGMEISNEVYSAQGEFDGDNEGEGLIYNVDYHGVTTHPSPSPKPKHPQP